MQQQFWHIEVECSGEQDPKWCVQYGFLIFRGRFVWKQRREKIKLENNQREFQKDFEYEYFNWKNLILYIASFMAIFEGNTCILGLYNETETPKSFIDTRRHSRILERHPGSVLEAFR